MRRLQISDLFTSGSPATILAGSVIQGGSDCNVLRVKYLPFSRSSDFARSGEKQSKYYNINKYVKNKTGEIHNRMFVQCSVCLQSKP